MSLKAAAGHASKTRSGLRRFANAQGAVLYIGKRDDGSVCVVVNSKKLMEDIPNTHS